MAKSCSGTWLHAASAASAAIDAAATLRPEVVLLDIGLPNLNGYEVCRRIRAESWGSEMLLVALTGWGQDEDRHKSEEAGFDGHLVKPVELRALMKLLDTIECVPG